MWHIHFLCLCHCGDVLIFSVGRGGHPKLHMLPYVCDTAAAQTFELLPKSCSLPKVLWNMPYFFLPWSAGPALRGSHMNLRVFTWYVPHYPSPPAQGLSSGWRDGALCWMCLLACLGCGVLEWHKFSSKSFKKVRSVQFACLIGFAATSLSSVWGTGTKCLLSVQSVQFMNSSGPGAKPCRCIGTRCTMLVNH